MAHTSVSAEELQLRKRARRRLVGAIALVLIAVIVLPRVLEHQPRPARQQIEIQIPSPATPKDALPRGETVSANTPSGSAAAADAPSKPTPGVGAGPATGFVIQIGAFRDADKARAVEARIKASGYPAFTALVDTPQGERLRVRAGPFPTQEVALKTRERLKQLALIPRSSDGRIVAAGD